MSRRGAALLAIAALLLAVAAALWFRQPSREEVRSPATAPLPPAAEPSRPGDDPAPDTEMPPAQTPVAARTTAPLPADDAPIADVVAQLQARADAGDRLAACRLGAELVLCGHLENRGEHRAWGHGDVSEPPSSLPDDQHARWHAEQQWRQARLAGCRGLPAATKARGTHYLRQAALAGEPEAMRRYALGEHLAPYRNDLLASPLFDEWLREAPEFAVRAVRNGDVAVLDRLQHAYRTDDWVPFSGLVADDPEMARSLHLLMGRLVGRGIAGGGRLTAQQEASAEARAAAWHRDHFGGMHVAPERLFATSLDQAATGALPTVGLCRPAD